MTLTSSHTRAAALAAATVLGLTGLSACGSSEDTSSSSSSSSSSAAPSSSSAAPPPTASSKARAKARARARAKASSTASAKASSKASASSSGSATEKTAVITIKGYAYSGAKTVAAGSTVMIKNEDSAAHTVTADSGDAFNVAIAPGKTVSLTAPSKAGSYAYHCTYHSNMHGTLQVS